MSPFEGFSRKGVLMEGCFVCGESTHGKQERWLFGRFEIVCEDCDNFLRRLRKMVQLSNGRKLIRLFLDFASGSEEREET